jgi:predicted lipoprotein with Yx(FWY)xxD motif
MSRTRTLFLLPLSLLVLAAGCGSGGGSGGGYGSSSPPATPTGGSAAAVVKTTSGKLGTFLVDGKGRALYLFEKDKGPKSSCSGACAAAWPPLTTSGTPTSSGTVDASKLGTTTRSDGTREVTYNGHPLYLYAGDSAPGQTSGQGLDQFGAEWYVLKPSGSKIDEG